MCPLHPASEGNHVNPGQASKSLRVAGWSCRCGGRGGYVPWNFCSIISQKLPDAIFTPILKVWCLFFGTQVVGQSVTLSWTQAPTARLSACAVRPVRCSPPSQQLHPVNGPLSCSTAFLSHPMPSRQHCELQLQLQPNARSKGKRGCLFRGKWT